MAASVVAAGCSDVLNVIAGTGRSQLAILLQQPGARMPAAVEFFVSNGRTTTRTLSHPDGFNTQFLQVRFPPGSIASLNGRTAGSNDSVLVSVQPETGLYGFTLGASGVAFATSAAPTVTFYYGRYGDFMGSLAGSRYTSATTYAQALNVWHEEVTDRFSVAPGSGSAGTDAVAGSVTGAGSYLVAAPK